MDSLEDFVVTVYCWIDDHLAAWLRGRRLRARGPAPRLPDSEALTLLVLGEALGLDTDVAIWRYVDAHWRAWFPRLGTRRTFARQAAALWAVAQALQARAAAALGAFDDTLHYVDGVPIPVCRYGRKAGCVRLREHASVSYCASKKEWFYGLKGHLVVSARGVITAFDVTPAHLGERAAAWDVVAGLRGELLGDKGYAGQDFARDLAAAGLRLGTPQKRTVRRTQPRALDALVTRLRRIIETVLAQLTERFHLARVRARDRWHLTGRLARKLLAHTLGMHCNAVAGRPWLHLEALFAAA